MELKKGFIVIKNAIDLGLLDAVSRDFEAVALTKENSDVFKTANGDVKQIQNMHNTGSLFKSKFN